MPYKIDVTDRLIRCQYHGCNKVLGFTMFQGHDDRVKGYLSRDLVRTTWDHTLTYCPKHYVKVKKIWLAPTIPTAEDDIKLLNSEIKDELR